MTVLSELQGVVERVKELGTTGAEPVQLQRDAFYLATVLEAVLQQATLRPCHVSGTHAPDHHIHGTVCDYMRADAGQRMVAALGLDLSTAPHELHPAEGCYWCHNIPSQQEFRDKLIKSWEWAGVKPTAEMLEPAADGVHPGDTALVLSVLTHEWQTWQQATERLSLILTDRMGGEKQYFNVTRFWKTIDRLADEGRVERRGISARLPQEVVAAEPIVNPYRSAS